MPGENAVLDAIHSQRHTQQVKIRLPLALAKLPLQNSLEIIKSGVGLVAPIDFIQMSQRTCLGKLAYFIF
jgi:hypothetical protein